jgi:hypothetical protein
MADADVLPGARPATPTPLLERLRSSAAVIAAVAGAITGLWTIYEKVRADARHYTAASYETLAPQINQMTEVLRQLEQDNHQMKQVLAARAGRPVPKERPARERPAAATPPANPAAPPPPASATPPPAGAPASDDPLGNLLGTVNRTRDAVDAIRKVPDSFEKALQQRPK